MIFKIHKFPIDEITTWAFDFESEQDICLKFQSRNVIIDEEVFLKLLELANIEKTEIYNTSDGWLDSLQYLQ